MLAPNENGPANAAVGEDLMASPNKRRRSPHSLRTVAGQKRSLHRRSGSGAQPMIEQWAA